MIRRIGFACKFMHDDPNTKEKIIRRSTTILKYLSTTVQWLNRQTVDVAEERLWDIIVPTLPYKRLIEYVGSPQSLEWSDWVAMCSVYNQSLGVITGASPMYVITPQRESPKLENSKSPMSIIYAPWPTYCTCERQPGHC